MGTQGLRIPGNNNKDGNYDDAELSLKPTTKNTIEKQFFFTFLEFT